MVLSDPIADAFSIINNSVKGLHKSIVLKKSKLLVSVLKVLKENSFIGDYEIIEDGKQGLVKVNLIGTINQCLAIKPRYPVKIEELEGYEKRFLPAKDFGVLLISTNKGILTQKQAKEYNVGGTLIAYCY
ncbi:MAG: 30S ribosomal protein S8 [Nanoarchaeota archaeon]